MQRQYKLVFCFWRAWKMDGNKVAWQMYRWRSMYLLFIVDTMV